MALTGARIYNDGVSITNDVEEKIRHIVSAIKSISPSSEVSIRLLKAGHVYEGLLWGNVNKLPLGVYKRGLSVSQVLEQIYKGVKKECAKAWKTTRGKQSTRDSNSKIELAMAG